MLPACLPAAAWQPLPHGDLPPLAPVLDSSSRPYRPGRAGAGPRDCGGLSRAAGPGLLLLHGAETVSPGDELIAAALLASPSGARVEGERGVLAHPPESALSGPPTPI